MQKLGEILIAKGLITDQQLNAALEIQLANQSLIGRIMITENYIKAQNLHKVLAEKYQLPFIDLSRAVPDETVVNSNLQADYFALNIVPIYQSKGRVTLAITDLNEDVKSWSAANYQGIEVDYVITSPFDVLWYLQKLFAKNDDEMARLALCKTAPKFSAIRLFGRAAKPVFLMLMTAVLAAFYYHPHNSFLALGLAMNISCFLTVSFKSIVFLIGRTQPEILENNKVENFPAYTILLPLFKEEKSIKRLINALEKLDYPRASLDVKFVVENNDAITINAIKAANPPQYMEILRVPYSLPQTKPKACNYALNYARGEYITIYDAEDAPDPQQLKKSLAAFNEGGAKLACVQARLNYYNANKNLLTRWFALEYATWFEVVMRGLQKIKSPLPLGGTSNHIKTSVLKEVGGWDSFNVTEDADLGMRLAQNGYKCKVINSVTMEEAVSKFVPWIKQRTRWLKGFAQTYLVHMRAPRSLIKNTGWRGFATLQFFIGMPFLIYLLVPIWAVLANYYAMPQSLVQMSVFNLFYSAAAHILMANYVCQKLQDFEGNFIFKQRPIFAILSTPIYGLMMVFAAYRAFYQLIFKPHYWDKTDHG